MRESSLRREKEEFSIYSEELIWTAGPGIERRLVWGWKAAGDRLSEMNVDYAVSSSKRRTSSTVLSKHVPRTQSKKVSG